ncbi:MAG: Citrate (pro-3S)-lyase [Subtercola sp.]|jgi:citrate lyase subunit beta/citryl-CoA lyase|nr:Citrate (pro-3S)-lyase [Subtercola sp.]
MKSARTYLYIPGDRPDHLAKAFTRGADALVVDLEDAVSEPAKDDALHGVVAWLDSVSAPACPIWVRVNSGERREWEIHTLSGHPNISGIFLPKVDTAAEVDHVIDVVAALGADVDLAPMIESATGLVNIHAIAASPGVRQLHIGEIDLAADLGIVPGLDESELLHARSLLVMASRHAGLVPPAAPVSAEINDLDVYSLTTHRLKRMGFFGRDCIHPAQVLVANQTFVPSAAETSWAASVIEKAALNHGAFRDTDGSMVDEAVLRRARALLALALADESNRSAARPAL